MVRFTEPKMFVCIQILFIVFGSIVAEHLMGDSGYTQNFESIFGSTNPKIPVEESMKINSAPRVKRSIKEVISLQINTRTRRIFADLKPVTDSLVISYNTGIWMAVSVENSFQRVSYYPQRPLSEVYSEIYCYQDQTDGSAIVVFRKKNSPEDAYYMTGIIAEKYVIHNIYLSTEPGVQLIKDFIVLGKSRRSAEESSFESSEDSMESDSETAIRNANVELFQNFESSLDDSIIQKFQDNKKRQAESEIHPKLLVTVLSEDARSIVQDTLMEYMISYWNIVDLKLRQSTNIRLNLAGIIIPSNFKSTPYIPPNTSEQNGISSVITLNDISTFFSKDAIRFPKEKYDILVAMAVTKLCDNAVGDKCTSIEAKSLGLESICSSNSAGAVIAESSIDWKFKGTDGFANEIRKVTADSSCLGSKPAEVSEHLLSFGGYWLDLDGQCLNHDMESEKYCIISGETDTCRKLGCVILGKCRNHHLRPLRGSKCTTPENEEGRCAGHLCEKLP